ncbi:MAG: aminopeptidase [Lachnospiraceae bacterium]
MDEWEQERYTLAMERIQNIITEETVSEPFRDYFRTVAGFILQIDRIHGTFESGERESWSIERLAEENRGLYDEILPGNYEKSYANPEYADERLGSEKGAFLSALYAEMRAMTVYVFEGKYSYLTVLSELFIQIYNCFEEKPEPEYQALKDIFYWYTNDYSEVILADRIVEQINPDCAFAANIILNSDLTDLRYLYQYGEYVSENEIRTANHLNQLPEDVINKMAGVFTEGYRIGFIVGNKDLSKKASVNIRFMLGYERVVRKAIENFADMGLKPTMYRAAVSILTKRQQFKVGYYGTIANKQYEYDHRADQALILDKRMVERKLEVMKYTYEQNKSLAAKFAGPAVMEVFGEEPFSPQRKTQALSLSEKQEQLSLQFDSKSGQLTNEYIRGEERSFTIIAYPSPEIGDCYQEIFDEVIRINTLDAKLYQDVQQTIIDALDQGTYVHILGKAGNKTDLKVQLYQLADPARETIFENCVADVNIPVGEVFTSPVLEGTNGTLFVSKVYLNELQYRDLEINFANGMITDYTCSNFEREADSKKYIHENILHNHPTLPLGEFAIGTNTTAYVVAKKYQIEDKMPILIAEKMGPHFAVGDTCYSWSEDKKVYNPDGKEIVAKDNTISIRRKEDIEKAYFQCHTDITIPYEELGKISVITPAGEEIVIISDGRFVLAGTEILNQPLAELSDKNA